MFTLAFWACASSQAGSSSPSSSSFSSSQVSPSSSSSSPFPSSQVSSSSSSSSSFSSSHVPSLASSHRLSLAFIPLLIIISHSWSLEPRRLKARPSFYETRKPFVRLNFRNRFDSISTSSVGHGLQWHLKSTKTSYAQNLKIYASNDAENLESKLVEPP